MAIKSQSGSGSTSRDYRKGLKSALKANQYKVTSQKKGKYAMVSSKLAKKAKAGDKSAAGAGAAYSMLRQEAAASRRGDGTASAAVANRKRTVAKKTSSSRNYDRMTGGKSSGTKVTSTKKVAQSTSSKKEIGKGIVGVIKANKFKPVAQNLKNSNYGKLDATLRGRKASAEKSGNYTASQRATGALRGISVMRQDAAAANRGASKPVSNAAKNYKAVKKSKAATRKGSM